MTWACPACEKDFKQKECVSDGKYCAMNHQGQHVQGKDIIMEDLREYCLFNILNEQGKSQDWWKYMKEVHSYCYDYVTLDCSKQGIKEIGANQTQVD